MQQGRGVFCLVIFIIMVFLLPTVGLAGGTDSEQLSEEIRVLKSKLAEMDDLKAKLSELESKVSEVGRDKALKIVSSSLNHNRSSITLYYLGRM